MVDGMGRNGGRDGQEWRTGWAGMADGMDRSGGTEEFYCGFGMGALQSDAVCRFPPDEFVGWINGKSGEFF